MRRNKYKVFCFIQKISLTLHTREKRELDYNYLSINRKQEEKWIH